MEVASRALVFLLSNISSFQNCLLFFVILLSSKWWGYCKTVTALEFTTNRFAISYQYVTVQDDNIHTSAENDLQMNKFLHSKFANEL